MPYLSACLAISSALISMNRVFSYSSFRAYHSERACHIVCLFTTSSLKESMSSNRVSGVPRCSCHMLYLSPVASNYLKSTSFSSNWDIISFISEPSSKYVGLPTCSASSATYYLSTGIIFARSFLNLSFSDSYFDSTCAIMSVSFFIIYSASVWLSFSSFFTLFAPSSASTA